MQHDRNCSCTICATVRNANATRAPSIDGWREADGAQRIKTPREPRSEREAYRVLRWRIGYDGTRTV